VGQCQTPSTGRGTQDIGPSRISGRLSVRSLGGKNSPPRHPHIGTLAVTETDFPGAWLECDSSGV